MENKERDEVIFFPRRELKQTKEASVLVAQFVEKVEVVEVGVQASPTMVDATTEPKEEAFIKAMERK